MYIKDQRVFYYLFGFGYVAEVDVTLRSTGLKIVFYEDKSDYPFRFFRSNGERYTDQTKLADIEVYVIKKKELSVCTQA